MISFLKRILFGKNIADVLYETKVVKAGGVRFKIKRVEVLDHLSGANVLQQYYDTYSTAKDEKDQKVSDKKIKEYFSQIIVAGVVDPKIVHKEGEDGILVSRLFTNFEMVMSLYEAIMAFTYGKKKVIR